jgi:hypothetical protein
MKHTEEEMEMGNKTDRPDPTPRMTYEEWMAEGQKRFGTDFETWRFVCPICGNVASVADFRLFKDRGATPDSATNQCIGRFDGSTNRAFGSSLKERGKPCDYALFGLFRLPGVIIAMPDGKERMAFAFGAEQVTA